VGAIVCDGDEPVGAIVACVEDADAFTERDERFLDAVASILGAVLQRDAAAADRPPGEQGSPSEETFARLFSASPDAIVLIVPHDPDGSWPIVDCNEAACAMNGYERDELIGRSIDVLNLTPGTPRERRAYLARLRRKRVISLETHHRRDGRVIPVEVSTSLVTLGDRESCWASTGTSATAGGPRRSCGRATSPCAAPTTSAAACFRGSSGPRRRSARAWPTMSTTTRSRC
jgi:PAS domain S-box-containing protein